MRRRFAVVVAGLAVALALAGTAEARSYSLIQSNVRVQVEESGNVRIEEEITVSFSGAFTFGYRDIPLREGETIRGIGVSEAGRAYRPGAATELEPGGPPGRYGTERRGNEERIVWRFEAADEARTFTLRYAIRGLAVA
jgi:hypothetical protein